MNRFLVGLCLMLFVLCIAFAGRSQDNKPPTDVELANLKAQYQLGVCNISVEQLTRENTALKKELEELKKKK